MGGGPDGWGDGPNGGGGDPNGGRDSGMPNSYLSYNGPHFDNKGRATTRPAVQLDKLFTNTIVVPDAKSDPAWVTRYLSELWVLLTSKCTEKRFNSKLAPADMDVGDLGCTWEDTLPILFFNKLEGGPRIKAFKDSSSTLRDGLMHQVRTLGRSDKAAYEWFTQEVVSRLLGGVPEQTTMALFSYSVVERTFFSEIFDDLASRVHTSIDIHPDTESSGNTNDQMRVKALIEFAKRQMTGLLPFLVDVREYPQKYTSRQVLGIFAKHKLDGFFAGPTPADFPPVFPLTTQLPASTPPPVSSNHGHGGGGATRNGNGSGQRKNPVLWNQRLDVAVAAMECMATDIERKCFNCDGVGHSFLDCRAKFSLASWTRAAQGFPSIKRWMPKNEAAYTSLRTRIQARRTGPPKLTAPTPSAPK